ncbi:MAG: hypothetical protein Q8898_09725 [Bacillota bacterium]|nr:hypothetical protein [Bacillota bacterium]
MQPILDKRPPHPYDYKPMNWKRFISLRKWAEKLANETGFPVYLVGSVLEKETPRDFDVSVIMPFEEYERRYGKWPDDPYEQNEYMQHVFRENIRHYFDGRDAIGLGEMVSLDLKFCPDTWWTDKPKLLLAEPKHSYVLQR